MSQDMMVTVIGPEVRPFYAFDVGDFLVSLHDQSVGIKVTAVSILWMTGDRAGRTVSALAGADYDTVRTALTTEFIVPLNVDLQVQL